MARDASLDVRRAALTALKADAAMTALVAATSIHPQVPREAPVWPFIKWGAPSGIPIRAACVDGNEITVAVHGFSKGVWSGGALTETAEDHAARIGAQIAATLDCRRFDLGGGGHATFRWAGSQLLVDGDEADAFHSVQNFEVRVIA